MLSPSLIPFLPPSLPPKVLAYSVAGVGVAAFSGGVVDALKSEEIMSTLRSMTEESQQVRWYIFMSVRGLCVCVQCC